MLSMVNSRSVFPKAARVTGYRSRNGRHQYSRSLFKLKQKKYTLSCPSSNKWSCLSKSYNTINTALFQIAQPRSITQRPRALSAGHRACTSTRREHWGTVGAMLGSLQFTTLRCSEVSIRSKVLSPQNTLRLPFLSSVGGNRLLWGLSLSPFMV